RKRRARAARHQAFSGHLAYRHRFQVLHHEPAEHRPGARRQLRLAHEAVLVLDEQPGLGVLRTHERERALRFLAAQLETELAFRQPLAHARFRSGAIAERELAALVRAVDAAIPDHDLARAVLTARDHAFERAVGKGMVLG